MSDTEKIAELIKIKRKTLDVEEKIKSLIIPLGKKQKIDFERPDDYGTRGFVLYIHFDEMNIRIFDNADEIKTLWSEFIELRKKQKLIETEVNSVIATNAINTKTILAARGF